MSTNHWSICFLSTVRRSVGLFLLLGSLGLGVPSLLAATIELTGTVRDFRDSHPDFQSGFLGEDPGIVERQLGPDGKPVYAGTRNNPSTHGRGPFDQWFRDVEGVNRSQDLTITLSNRTTSDRRVYTYSDDNFFPIDRRLFGNQGRSHNYHFTFELNASFRYQGGEMFEFRGDDDVWVFIDGRLVIDLGGVHGPLSEKVRLDSLGLVKGQVYPFALFFAERQTVGSHFRIDTSIVLEDPQDAVIPQLSVADARVAEGAQDTYQTLEFALSGSAPLKNSVDLRFVLSPAGAEPLRDYTPPNSTSVTLPAGEVRRSIFVPVNGDTSFETDEQLTLQLLPGEGYELDRARAVGVIVNDDVPPVLSVAPLAIEEGDDGELEGTFEVSLAGETELPLAFHFATTDGTALADRDYLPRSGRVVLSPGDQIHQIVVPIKGDRLVEADETFGLVLSEPIHVSFTSPTVTATIIDNDSAVNLPPTIASITDQSMVFGASLSPVPVLVADAETPLARLRVTATIERPARRVIESVELLRDNEGHLSLLIGNALQPTGAQPVFIRVTVVDEGGLTATTVLSLSVTNRLPAIEILSPSPYSIFQIPENAGRVDVPVEVRLNDDQFVPAVRLLLDGQFLGNPIEPSAFDSTLFSSVLTGLEVGVYEVQALAVDPGTGEEVFSEPVVFKVVAGGRGEVAIVHPEAEDREEVYALWDYLVALGYQPDLFLEHELTVAGLSGYRGVIWHDLGSADLSERTVDVLSELQASVGMPIYLIGTQLAAERLLFSAETQERWADLTQLQPTEGSAPLADVRFGTEASSDRSQVGAYWALVDGFALEGEAAAGTVGPRAEVLADAGDGMSPLVLRYPSTNGQDSGAPRRFVQSFPLRAGGDETSVFARRVLFENALCYLLAENALDCECESAVITTDIAQQTTEQLKVGLGESFVIDFMLNNNGRCLARGGQLALQLPEGLEVVGVESSKGIPMRWEGASRTAYFAVGIVEPASEDIELHVEIQATLPGLHTLGIASSGNNFDGTVTELAAMVEGAALHFERALSGQLELVVQGTPGTVVSIEAATELGSGARWQVWRRLEIPERASEQRVRVETTGEQRLFRLSL